LHVSKSKLKLLLLAYRSSQNTAIGSAALAFNTTGSLNTAVGDFALGNNSTGRINTALSTSAGYNVTRADDVICIGGTGANVNNSCFIGNVRGVATESFAAPRTGVLPRHACRNFAKLRS
jgi:hypothetical protein